MTETHPHRHTPQDWYAHFGIEYMSMYAQLQRVPISIYTVILTANLKLI